MRLENVYVSTHETWKCLCEHTWDLEMSMWAHMCETWLFHMYGISHSHEWVWRIEMSRCTKFVLWCIYTHIINMQMRRMHMHKLCAHGHWNTRHAFVWMRHATHTWKSHVSHMCAHIEFVYSTRMRVNETCHTCEWVMSYIWMSKVTHMNETYHTYEWARSHMWMSYITHLCSHRHLHTSTSVWMWHVIHMNEPCYTHLCSHRHLQTPHARAWTRHITRMNKPCHECRWVKSNICAHIDIYILSTHLWMYVYRSMY